MNYAKNVTGTDFKNPVMCHMADNPNESCVKISAELLTYHGVVLIIIYSG